MKRLALILLFIGAFFCVKAQTNGLNIYKIDKMLKGQWVSVEDTAFKVTIKGDTLIEKRPYERRRYTFTIENESCDADEDKRFAKKSKLTPTGFYLNESSMAYDGVQYCDILVSISDSTMTWFSTGKIINLTKKK